jgi:hypothetical protein
MLCKLIYKVYYNLLLVVCKALNRFRVEIVHRYLGAIESSRQRCTVDLVLVCRAQKFGLVCLLNSARAKAIQASLVESDMIDAIQVVGKFTKKGVLD